MEDLLCKQNLGIKKINKKILALFDMYVYCYTDIPVITCSLYGMDLVAYHDRI